MDHYTVKDIGRIENGDYVEITLYGNPKALTGYLYSGWGAVTSYKTEHTWRLRNFKDLPGQDNAVPRLDDILIDTHAIATIKKM